MITSYYTESCFFAGSLVKEDKELTNKQIKYMRLLVNIMVMDVSVVSIKQNMPTIIFLPKNLHTNCKRSRDAISLLSSPTYACMLTWLDYDDARVFSPLSSLLISFLLQLLYLLYDRLLVRWCVWRYKKERREEEEECLIWSVPLLLLLRNRHALSSIK